jgi:hypothetical protein
MIITQYCYRFLAGCIFILLLLQAVACNKASQYPARQDVNLSSKSYKNYLVKSEYKGSDDEKQCYEKANIFLADFIRALKENRNELLFTMLADKIDNTADEPYPKEKVINEMKNILLLPGPIISAIEKGCVIKNQMGFSCPYLNEGEDIKYDGYIYWYEKKRNVNCEWQLSAIYGP